MAPAAQSVLFTNEEDLVALLSTDGEVGAVDDDASGALSPQEVAYVTRACNYATSRCIWYLGTRYATGDLAQSWIVNEWATILACWWLRCRRGNPSPASLKDMAEQANNIARIKSRQGLADGALVFTKAQLEAADALISERYAALAQSPECRDRVCPRCGAEIRIAQAQEIPGAPAGHVGV